MTEYDEKFRKSGSDFSKTNTVIAVEDRLREICLAEIRYAQAGVSGVKVASAVYAQHKTGVYDYFSGVNIEFASSLGVHAEVVALIKAISDGYINIVAVGETSTMGSHVKPLCAMCRHYYNCVNPNVGIFVFDYSKGGETIYKGVLSELEREQYIPRKLIK